MFRLKIGKAEKNAAWVIGCKLAQSVLSFIISMLTARYLGPDNYGLLNYAISVVAFFAPFANLGMSSILVKEIVDDENGEGKTLGTAISLSVMSAFLSLIGAAAFVGLSNPGDTERLIVCILYGLSLVFTSTELLGYWFLAKLKSKYTSIISLVAYLGVTAYKIFLLATAKSIAWFALSYSIDFALISILQFIVYHKIGGQGFRFSFDKAKHLFNEGKHYIISSLMVVVFSSTDKVMLDHMLGDKYTGYYSAAVTCAGMLGFVMVAIIDSFRPIIFENAKKSKELFEESLSKLYCIITYLSLFVSLGITIFASLIIWIIYGEAYLPAISTLRIVVWYTTFSYYSLIRNIWILNEKKQKYLVFINLSGAVANVILNFILIPIMGVNGAAVASLCTQLVTGILIIFIFPPIKDHGRILLNGIKPKLLIQIIKEYLKPSGEDNK